MLTDFPIQGILDQLVERIVEILPITGAGVTVISPGVDPRYIAASDGPALIFEQLQSNLGEGPCLVAYHSGEAVSVPDLSADRQFPAFTPRALTEGLAAVFAFPLRHGKLQLGALDLYRGSPGPLSPDAMDAAQTLADVAAAYLLNAQSRVDLQDSSDRSLASSLHDALTGLPNRVLLMDRLNHAFLRGLRRDTTAGVLFVDLDRFKTVNDLHGHAVGDELLVAVAHRLTPLLRLGDTLARLSGDEFVVLCEDLDTDGSAAQVAAIAERLCSALSQPFILTDHLVDISASVGFALASPDRYTPEQLLHDADTAMYQAKRNGGNRTQIFEPNHQRIIDKQTGLAHDLRHGLALGQLHTVYQPIVETADGRIIGLEALLRWTHPVQGPVPPATLIPIAEQSGLITEIGAWILRQALADTKRWQRPGGPLSISVNVSPVQLMSPGFATTVAAILAGSGLDPALLTLEVTESVFVSDSDRALVVLQDLRRIGVRLALDDFGTGYSSLSYLLRFPIDIIKIDRSFITDLGQDRISHEIVSAIIRLSHGLGMSVTAEGVETAEQLQLLTELGCDSCQGYFFARPMSDAAVGGILRGGASSVPRRLPVSRSSLD
ncbi:MAG: hypothetical protein JWN95_1002 [Frankiales bacterium]|nr:hypothetical protein [Frankiales bacterium]